MSVETFAGTGSAASGRKLLGLYGDVDFDLGPASRLALGPDDRVRPAVVREGLPGRAAPRTASSIDLMATATMRGDVVCDAYVEAMADHGMQKTIELVRVACRDGIDAVDDPPAELVAFIDAMETVPDWIDLDLIELGSRLERIPAALAAPFAIRGAFLATFLNEYAALPMALTGSLSDKRAAKRVNETASFFASTVLPGGMDRDGPGFEAAAMVRLMHSMVRYNALRRSDRWDQARFGIPIPQVDQMPAGLISAFLLSTEAIKAGRDEFNTVERAQIEVARYRCHLLGLPEEPAADGPARHGPVFLARAATLRKGFGDATCARARPSHHGRLPAPDRSLLSRVAEEFERSFSTAFFVKVFLAGDRDRRQGDGGRRSAWGTRPGWRPRQPRFIFGRLAGRVRLLNKGAAVASDHRRLRHPPCCVGG